MEVKLSIEAELALARIDSDSKYRIARAIEVREKEDVQVCIRERWGLGLQPVHKKMGIEESENAEGKELQSVW